MATGPDTGIAFLSLAEAKEIIEGSTATTTYSSPISDLVNAAAMRFNAECGRTLKNSSHTEYYDGNGTNSLYLENYPLTSTSITITIDENRAFTDTDDQITSTDVILSTESARVRLDGDTFNLGTANVKVAYSAGYTTTADHDLVQATREFVQFLWDRRTGRQTESGVDNESFEGESISYEQDLPWSVKQVLLMYRDRRGG